MSKTRIPVIALDYSEKHKADKKEMLIDYTTGNIYVVSATDKTIIFDITKKILDKIESISGNNIIIEIEGIGEVNLSELIAQIKREVGTKVDAIEIDTDIIIPRDKRLDGKSLEEKYNMYQLTDFSSAEQGMIPQKYNGKVRWIYPPKAIDDGGNSDHNPEDGQFTTNVIILNPIEGKIHLNASKRQKTIHLCEDVNIILPVVLDEFCEIFWLVDIREVLPRVTFDNKCNFNTSTITMKNKFHIFKFSTWDGGESWFSEVSFYDFKTP
ncbi:MAG: hypothetical protein ACRDD7_09635 [Peptostreptococcaceae bacterium]